MTDRAAAPTRTLQIHVTRRCNLACLHCYSSSGPDAREALDPDALKAALADARALGYGFVTLSGGEPFLYPPMVDLLAEAKRLGPRTGVVTNGMFNDPRRLAPLRGVLDLLVVSLDGAPDRHDAIRANPRAFAVMASKLPALRDSGIPFGFLFTLSRDNVVEIDWAADFAAAQGAAMLQIHPLEIAGRALEQDALAGAEPDLDAAWEAAERAAAAQKRHAGRLRVVVDYQPNLPDAPRPVPGACGCAPRFADRAHPLCIETDGTVTPMGHGFARGFALGRLGEAPLADMAAAWDRDGRGARYERLVAATREAAYAADAPPLVNIAQAIRSASHRAAPLAGAG